MELAQRLYSVLDFYELSDTETTVEEENDIEDYQRAYLDDVEEYASGNGYMETEDDYEE